MLYKDFQLHQPSYLSSLLSPQRQSHVLRSSASDLLSAVFIDKHCFLSVFMLRPYPLEQSSLIRICTADNLTCFIGRSSRLTCSQVICSRYAVRPAHIRNFARYKFVTYLRQQKAEVEVERFGHLFVASVLIDDAWQEQEHSGGQQWRKRGVRWQ